MYLFAGPWVPSAVLILRDEHVADLADWSCLLAFFMAT